MPARRCFAFLPLALILAGPALAADPLAVRHDQLRALGIELIAASAPRAAGARHPARVTLPPAAQRIVAAPLGGRIETLAVAPGDPVREGQVLGQLASPQALELQRAAVQAESQARLTAQTLARDELLHAEGLIPAARLQASRDAALRATAEARGGKRNLALAGIAPATVDTLAGNVVLRAPRSGVVLEQGASVGQQVDAQTAIYRIADLSRLWLDIQIPAEALVSLRPGQALTVSPGGASGHITRIGRAVDPGSQTVLVRGEIDGRQAAAEALRVGQAVTVELPLPAGAATVPAGAIVRQDGQAQVYRVLSEDGDTVRFLPHPVRVTAEGGGQATVQGLADGSRIAGQGASALKSLQVGVGR